MEVKGLFFTIEGLLSLFLLLLIISTLNISPEYPSIKQSICKEQAFSVLHIWNENNTKQLHLQIGLPLTQNPDLLCLQTLGTSCTINHTRGDACLYRYTSAGLEKVCLIIDK